MARALPKRGRSTRAGAGNQGSSGVGADDRDRQGQRVQDQDSIWARGEERQESASTNTKRGPREGGAKKVSRDEGDQTSRGGSASRGGTKRGARAKSSRRKGSRSSAR